MYSTQDKWSILRLRLIVCFIEEWTFGKCTMGERAIWKHSERILSTSNFTSLSESRILFFFLLRARSKKYACKCENANWQYGSLEIGCWVSIIAAVNVVVGIAFSDLKFSCVSRYGIDPVVITFLWIWEFHLSTFYIF